MFKFSGKLSRSEWWAAIGIIFPLYVVVTIIFNALIKSYNQEMLYSSYNSYGSYGHENFALPVWLFIVFAIHLAIYISGSGVTARRLRDAGKSREQINAYYWLIWIPFTAPFALIVYLFIAGFSPSRLGKEDEEQERLKQTEAEAEYRHRREEESYRKQAESWAHDDERSSYASGADAQAKKWAEEETKAETEQESRLLPRK